MAREAHLRELENFLNRQMDWDWCWKPFLFLRPSRTLPMGAKVIFGYFLPQTVLIPVFFAYTVACLSVFNISATHHSVHPSLPLITRVAFGILALPDVQVFVTIMIVAALGMFGLYVWAWNRRAARMQRKASAPANAADPGAWPPPPQQA